MALAWFFADERSDATEAVFEKTDDHTLFVPVHWYIEVTNGMLVGERRKRVEPAESLQFAETLSGLRIEIDFLDAPHYLRRILPLARAHALTAYDALYLELAMRRALPLATLDSALAKAAQAVGVTVLGR